MRTSFTAVIAAVGGLYALPTSLLAAEVNIYSHRHYEADKELYKTFTEQTGIKVNVVKAGADALIQRLKTEGKNSPADLLMTADAGRLYRAKEEGLLQPFASEQLIKQVPSDLRDPDNQWVALTVRARVLIYAKDRVSPSDLSTYEALAEDGWKNRVLCRSSSNIYNQSLLASIISAHGRDGALDWAKAVRSNMARPPRGSDRDQIRTVAAGLGDVAIANTYYLGLLKESPEQKDREVFEKVGVFFPNQGDSERGAHINASGAGITAHSKNKENATKLLEFLVSDAAQKVYASTNFEYPLKPENNENALLQSWGEFKRDSVALDELGKNNAEATRLFDLAGWE